MTGVLFAEDPKRTDVYDFTQAVKQLQAALNDLAAQGQTDAELRELVLRDVKDQADYLSRVVSWSRRDQGGKRYLR